jgi:hypothetical protein
MGTEPKSDVRSPMSEDPNSQSAIRNSQLTESRISLRDRALIRLALAGPTPRFLIFCAGKVLEALAMRRSQAIQRRSTQRMMISDDLQDAGFSIKKVGLDHK